MLETIWFALWGILWAMYFMLDGFDLGLGTLRPFVAKDNHENRVVYNSMGPFWDGNEVWLITAGGVTFAAFPSTYAVMFSALYSPLLLLLFGLILRGVAFEYRSKVDSPGWRTTWDYLHLLGSFLPALLF
jgi:cytochrome d ubiquinol oxidase subunit II